MSLESISKISEKFQTETELQQYCDRQYVALKQARDIIQSLRSEVTHLKVLLSSSNHLVNSPPELIVKSVEQSICEIQIEMLRGEAMSRQLTLEETKRLDLLVKNLLLCKGAYKDIKADYTALPKGLSSRELLEIAAVTSLDNS